MFENLKGKKLLILGATSSEIEIVNAAKKFGIYTITTDNHVNWDDAPAKLFSDAAWNISWSDLDKLKIECIKEKIDGIIAGFSEKRIIAANDLSQKVKKPFYANLSNLDTITDKVEFKKVCVECGIRVPKDYSISDDIKFPVIVKPADNGGSRGISICYSKEELLIAYSEALKWSNSKNVVIEEYLTSDEVMVYFTVHNGIVTLSAMCDRIMKRFDKKITQLPVAYIYESRYLDIFKKYNLKKFENLLNKLNIKNGLIAFQSFVVGNEIIPFDPTYRLDGTMAYNFTKEINDISALDMLIHYSLTGRMTKDDNFILEKENPKFNKIGFEFPILLKKGIIAEINGIDEIKEIPNVIKVYSSKKVGCVMEKSADFSQMLCRIFICVSNYDSLQLIIKKIFEKINVKDENGNDMILYHLDDNDYDYLKK